MPDAGHLVIFHFVLSGSARVKMDQHDPLVLSAGDIVMFPHGDPHCMVNGVSPQSLDPAATVKLLASRNLGPVRAGGGGEVTQFVCGYMACDPQLCQPILAGFPRYPDPYRRRLFRATAGEQHPPVGRGGRSGRSGYRRHAGQTRRNAVCGCTAALCGIWPKNSWVAGRGARSGSRQEFGDPAQPRESPMDDQRSGPLTPKSRSSLVERFTRYLGEPPISYLTQWRLQLGARPLAATPRSVAE